MYTYVLSKPAALGARRASPRPCTCMFLLLRFCFFRGNTKQATHIQSQSSVSRREQSRIRCWRRLTEGNAPAPAHYQEAPAWMFSGILRWISSGMFQRTFTCQWYFKRIVTFPVDVYWQLPMDFQW